MRKIFNISLFIILIISWGIIINSDKKIEIKKINFEITGDEYYKNAIYKDAMENYLKSYNLIPDIKLNKKIILCLKQMKEYKKIISLLNSKDFNQEYIEKIESDILDYCIQEKKYKELNNYIKLMNYKVKNKYEELLKGKYYEYNNEYTDINYSPIDDKFFIVNMGLKNSWTFINLNSKIINSNRYDYILGLDYPLFTIKDKEGYKVYDFKNEIRAFLKYKNIKQFKDGYLVNYIDRKYFYINRAGEEKRGPYSLASNFQNGKAIVKDKKIKLIDKNFNIIKEFNYKNIKLDNRNNAISDNKIILKDNKYIMYDIKKNIYSKEYDDIEFSNGGYIAIKIGDKWGYMDNQFNERVEAKYEKAKSFGSNVGVVKDNKKYKIIDIYGKELYIRNEEIKPFNNRGVSFIKKNKFWKMIKLVRYIND